MRSTSRSWKRRPCDLGADAIQTFRHVTLPVIATAAARRRHARVRAVVRRDHRHEFHGRDAKTLPIWIFNNLKLPNQRPIVNVVAVVVILLSAIPVYLAQRWQAETAAARTR